MAIKVIVNGATGRMGKEVVAAVTEDPALTLVAAIDKRDDLHSSIIKHQAQVVVDFTIPAVAFRNVQIILESGAYPVVGTTGISSQHMEELTHQCEQLKRGAIVAPNFSIAAVLMMKYAREIAHYYSDVEIIEKHHDRKIDSPSGTAIKSAEMIAEKLLKSNEPSRFEEKIKGTRGGTHCRIPIHSIRLPGLLAHQEIIFGSTGETLSLRHDTINRTCFMPGVIFACKKVLELNHLVYGLENLL